MRNLASITGALVCAISLQAAAEIFQSKDAEGNPVFTDTPTRESTPVELQDSNIADHVTPREHESASETAPATPSGGDGTSNRKTVVIIGDDEGEDTGDDAYDDVPYDPEFVDDVIRAREAEAIRRRAIDHPHPGPRR